MQALTVAADQMARDETNMTTGQDLPTALRDVCEITKIAETEIHAIVSSCARARRQMLVGLPATKPTLH
jgi:hypothetical protein